MLRVGLGGGKEIRWDAWRGAEAFMGVPGRDVRLDARVWRGGLCREINVEGGGERDVCGCSEEEASAVGVVVPVRSCECACSPAPA